MSDSAQEAALLLSGPEVEPRSGGRARQLVIFLHGLGADGSDLIGLAGEFSEILPEAHFISPNAPFPCDMAPYGYQWFSLRDWSTSTMMKGARIAAPILNGFIDAMLEKHGVIERNLALIGFSQGAMMSLFVGLRRNQECAGILGYSGAIIDNPATIQELKSKPNICLVHGAMDPVVPYVAMDNAVKLLNKVAIPVEYHTRPLLAHGIDYEGIEIGKKFLKRIFY